MLGHPHLQKIGVFDFGLIIVIGIFALLYWVSALLTVQSFALLCFRPNPRYVTILCGTDKLELVF
jgi:hypothetical protein